MLIVFNTQYEKDRFAFKFKKPVQFIAYNTFLLFFLF